MTTRASTTKSSHGSKRFPAEPRYGQRSYAPHKLAEGHAMMFVCRQAITTDTIVCSNRIQLRYGVSDDAFGSHSSDHSAANNCSRANENKWPVADVWPQPQDPRSGHCASPKLAGLPTRTGCLDPNQKQPLCAGSKAPALNLLVAGAHFLACDRESGVTGLLGNSNDQSPTGTRKSSTCVDSKLDG